VILSISPVSSSLLWSIRVISVICDLYQVFLGFGFTGFRYLWEFEGN
jgi:hypothetical protein